MHRKLSETFMSALQSGFLSALRETVIADQDLDLQIRDNYLNIYFKGNSLLKLTESTAARYEVCINDKFEPEPKLLALKDKNTTEKFIEKIPRLKENIIKHGKNSLEVEYEQLIIRANNLESKSNSEYFIIDRQYVTEDETPNRFDLTGFYWRRQGRRRGDQVPLCLMEVKFALNPDIENVHIQISRYYNFLRNNIKPFAAETQNVFLQKLDLGLINQGSNRTEALRTLQFSPNIEEMQFVLILVDYNPFSKLLDIEKIKKLSFAKQIKIFYTGFAMWEKRLNSYPELEFKNEWGEV